MTKPTLLLALLVLAAVAPACHDALHGDPASAKVEVHAPFQALTYEAALEAARTQDHVVMLDFTASWCPPCREMEESTWPDADVQAWVAREAVAIQVDVDREGELARKFRASSIPTIVFVEPSGKELGRFVGYKDPAGFLAEAERYVE